ncbi:unnamed protein product [Prorocentrum cordatum]|uniref:Uncharacterized protein n=1 Tax=Prorocentrum cordatum TaxID=2364126 RepID=A0ABN9UYT9_9DINO|nr:unnamed protein product [Polarella glacialis]
MHITSMFPSLQANAVNLDAALQQLSGVMQDSIIMQQESQELDNAAAAEHAEQAAPAAGAGFQPVHEGGGAVAAGAPPAIEVNAGTTEEDNCIDGPRHGDVVDQRTQKILQHIGRKRLEAISQHASATTGCPGHIPVRGLGGDRAGDGVVLDLPRQILELLGASGNGPGDGAGSQVE